jgi:hypothetical protein
MLATLCHCLDDPRELWQQKICLSSISKDVRGELHLLERKPETCDELDCRTLKTDHLLKVEVQSHEPCDSELARALDGVLYVRKLVTAFSDGSGERRGPHAGAFVWVGAGVRVAGTMAGMTNVGTHREPAFDKCQECDARGFMEGRLCGPVTRADNPRLVGCTVTAVYRFRFDPSEGGQDTAIVGTVEGDLVCPCGKRGCLDLGTFPAMSHANPWTVSGTTFQVFDHTGTPTTTADVVAWGGHTGLNAGYETRVDLGAPASSVDITLVHFSAPATVTALDASGAVVDTDTMTASGGVPETLQLTGTGIASLAVRAPSNETLIVEICTTA